MIAPSAWMMSLGTYHRQKLRKLRFLKTENNNAKDELELSELPRRGAWGSVTARNFPGALSEAFERAILQAARKRGAQ